MATPTTTSISVSESQHVMTDSGIISSSTTSLRLASSSCSTSVSSASMMMPKVRMPNVSESIMNTSPTVSNNIGSNSMQDSGISCSTDLMMRLSLSSGSSSAESSSRNGQTQSTQHCENSETWREYFEPDEDGDVQLHLAVAEGLADVVEALIRLAPSTQLLSIQNNQGYSPLHIAVLKNQPAFVRRLVVAGARLELRDGEGHSPLHLAARRGYVECAEALLKPVAVHEVGHGGGIRVQAAVQQVDILDQRNANGEHSVHLATMGGHIPFLVFLSWNNADMNALEGRAGRSALHLAVGSQRLDLVQCLLEPKPRGCGSNPDILDWYGRTPHQLSMLNGNMEIATYMANHFGYPITSAGSSSWILEDNNPSEIDSDEEINNLGPKLVNSSA